METKMVNSRLDSVRRRLDFIGCFGVNLIGRKGGLALLWRNLEALEVYNFFQNHISAWIRTGQGNNRWFFMGFYGESKTYLRQHT